MMRYQSEVRNGITLVALGCGFYDRSDSILWSCPSWGYPAWSPCGDTVAGCGLDGWMDGSGRPGRTDGGTGRTGWTDGRDGLGGQTGRTGQTDGRIGQTDWTDRRTGRMDGMDGDRDRRTTRNLKMSLPDVPTPLCIAPTEYAHIRVYMRITCFFICVFWDTWTLKPWYLELQSGYGPKNCTARREMSSSCSW